MLHVIACCNPSAEQIAEMCAFVMAQPGGPQILANPVFGFGLPALKLQRGLR